MNNSMCWSSNWWGDIMEVRVPRFSKQSKQNRILLLKSTYDAWLLDFSRHFPAVMVCVE